MGLGSCFLCPSRLRPNLITAKDAKVAKDHVLAQERGQIRVLLGMGARGSWTAFSLLMALAVVVMVFNKLTVCSWVRRHNPAATISMIGGLLGAAACEASPSALVNHLWWAPTALDIIGAPYLVVFAWMGIQELLRRRKETISN